MNDVAIIGIGVLLPEIFSVDDFWHRTNTSNSLFTSVPLQNWNHMLYHDICGVKNGGFLSEIAVDIDCFSLKEQYVPFIDPRQLLVLECVRRCLIDAGYDQRDFDRENTSVILACGSNSGALRGKYEFSAHLPKYQLAPKTPLPQWNPHSYLGSLDNIVAGRVAHCFGFEGKNFVVDACCASALSAVSVAISELQTGQSNIVVTGGIDTLTAYEYIGLDKTGVLSHSGHSKSFSSDADGSVISEGAAILLLKRKKDALKDGDCIYALLKGFGASSNGKNKSVALPSTPHQIKAMNRAYEHSKVAPQTLGFIEAHGNATKIGDAAEAETITQFLDKHQVQQCAISTCKATLGHTRAIAGVVGIIRAALALKNKVFPLHAQQKNILPALCESKTAYLPAKPLPWFCTQGVRRAGVNAFGFGGANYHIVLEEHAEKNPVYGGKHWPWEIVLFEAATQTQLLEQLSLSPDQHLSLAKYAHSCCQKITYSQPLRLAIIVESIEALCKTIPKTIVALKEHSALPENVFFQRKKYKPKIAFIFNGQGSQHLQMTREMCMYLPQFQLPNILPKAHQDIIHHIFPGKICSKSANQLKQTQIAQPALAAIHQSYCHLLNDLQIHPCATAGHSYGEISALHCAGVFNEEQHMQLSVVRGQVMSGNGDSGMLSVFGDIEEVQMHIKDLPVVVANYNSPKQYVLSGKIKDLQIVHRQIPHSQFIQVSQAFHSPHMENARAQFAQHMSNLQIKPSKIDVYSNVTAQKYEHSTIKTTIAQQITCAVLFHDMIECMCRDNIDIFLEVGPKTIIRNLIKEIAPQTTSLSVDPQNGEIRGFLQTLAQLYTSGVDMCLTPLFSTRQLDSCAHNIPKGKNVWLVNGVKARKEKMNNEYDESLEEIYRYFSTLPQENATSEKQHSPIYVERNNHSEKNDVMLSFQKTMRDFLATQRQFLSIYQTNDHSMQSNIFDKKPAAQNDIDPIQKENTETTVFSPLQNSRITKENESDSKREINSNDDQQATFLNIVAKKTGYPIESLHLDQMIAEDLGIDSIKRVEIFEVLQDHFSIPREYAAASFTASTLRDIFQVLNSSTKDSTETQDIQKSIIEIIAQKTGYPQESIKANHILAEELGIDSIKRVEILEALQQQFAVDEEKSHALLTVESVDDIATILSNNVKKKLLRHLTYITETPNTAPKIDLPIGTFIIIGAQHILPNLSDKITANNCDFLLFDDLPPLENIKTNTSIAGIFYYSAQNSAQNTKYLFSLLKHFCRKLSSGAIVCCFSKNARVFSLADGNDHFFCSANSGILKTFAIEHPQLKVKHIEIKEITNMPAMDILWQEILSNDNIIEIGYNNTKRYTIDVKPTHHSLENGNALPQQKTILATGGLRGITAKILCDIVNEKDKVIVIGKSPIIEKQEELEYIEDPQQLFREIMKVKNVSPAQVHLEVQKVLQNKERNKNLGYLKKNCAQVNYYNVDVKNEVVFGSILQAVELQHPQIDLLIHGAGIISDNLIENKSEQEFAKVFDIKVNSLLTLHKYLSLENIPYIALFSSLASRFGNIGQADYVAANEFFNAFAHYLDKKTNGRVTSFNWGPWAQIGMAADLEQNFREKKIHIISPQQGCKIFSDELRYGKKGDVEILVGYSHD